MKPLPSRWRVIVAALAQEEQAEAVCSWTFTMELTQELVKKKVELLEQQKAKAAKLNELLDGAY